MYTIEFFSGLTGYKKNTLYNLCNDLNITGTKGQVKGNPGKALYSKADMDKLLAYQAKVNKGSSKETAVKEVLQEME